MFPHPMSRFEFRPDESHPDLTRLLEENLLAGRPVLEHEVVVLDEGRPLAVGRVVSPGRLLPRPVIAPPSRRRRTSDDRSSGARSGTELRTD